MYMDIMKLEISKLVSVIMINVKVLFYRHIYPNEKNITVNMKSNSYILYFV